MAKSVVVKPAAFCAITLHASRHRDTAHGVLLGSNDKNIVTVTEAVPISHGAVTLPLVETALGLLPNNNVVGWYTAPMLKDDEKAGTVAMRMVESLATVSSEPVLLVVQNEALGDCLKGGSNEATVLKAFGKESQQWMESLKLTVEDSNKAYRAAREGRESQVELNDFVDHLEGDASSSWYPNAALNKIIDSI